MKEAERERLLAEEAKEQLTKKSAEADKARMARAEKDWLKLQEKESTEGTPMGVPAFNYRSRDADLSRETCESLGNLRDQAPGVSTILKTPNKGPYRIDKLEDRNVTLTDLGTGKTVHSHIQNIRPLEMSEFRLLLSKGWDLNAHQLKAGLPISRPGIFDFPEHPVPTETVIEIERQQDRFPEEGDLPNIFQAPEEEPAQAPPGQAEVCCCHLTECIFFLMNLSS